MKSLFSLILALASSAPAIRAAGEPATCQVWARRDTVHVLRAEPAGPDAGGAEICIRRIEFHPLKP